MLNQELQDLTDLRPPLLQRARARSQLLVLCREHTNHVNPLPPHTADVTCEHFLRSSLLQMYNANLPLTWSQNMTNDEAHKSLKAKATT